MLPRYNPRYSPRSLRILVADDEPDSVAALKLLLNDEGHDVVGLSKGAEVLRMIEEFKPDAVVLDIAMPDLSGYEIAKEIRKRYGVITPLLIAITGRYKQASDRMLGQIVGFDHYLLKPYEPNELLALLRFC
ncbi:MAG TPA: response regulator [Burkholderiales bacterium]|nr:response regulator [Burkholderiales bacterium]